MNLLINSHNLFYSVVVKSGLELGIVSFGLSIPVWDTDWLYVVQCIYLYIAFTL